MDVNKFLQSFGLLFVFLGAVIGVGLAVCGVVAGMGSLIFMGASFLALFCGIGGFFAWTGINNMNRERRINENGFAVMGKIFDYVPDRTGHSDTAEFPRGATVTISIHNGEAALVPGSVSDVRLPDEENLMNPDFDPENVHSSIGVSCPSCGAMLTVPVEMSAICPYCGRKIKYDGSRNVK